MQNALVTQKKSVPSEEPNVKPLSFFDWIHLLLFMVIVAIMFASVIFRYALNNALLWSDEMIRFLFVWFTLLGSVLVFRDKAAIRVDFCLEMMPTPWKCRVAVLEALLIAGFYLFLMIGGVIWVLKTDGTSMSSMPLPLNWCFFAALPTTSFLALVDVVRPLLRHTDRQEVNK